MTPDFITFTGADDHTLHRELLALSASHDVEFGILFSQKRQGTPRFPSPAWVDKLHGMDLSLAAHICGTWSRQIIDTGASDIDDRMSDFDRIQVNTNKTIDIERICKWKKRLHDLHGREFRVILQTRNVFPEDPRVEWLFDASGGRGLVPATWPRPPKNRMIRFGYSGGLCPDNILSALRDINVPEGYWVDMETGVRNSDDRFDLYMCRKVCRQVANGIIPGLQNNSI